MNKPQNQPQSIKPAKADEIKTEGPLSEKDEVKAAERKMTENVKNASKDKSK